MLFVTILLAGVSLQLSACKEACLGNQCVTPSDDPDTTNDNPDDNENPEDEGPSSASPAFGVLSGGFCPVRTRPGEACAEGELTCSPDLRCTCGNGHIDQGEECDGGDQCHKSVCKLRCEKDSDCIGLQPCQNKAWQCDTNQKICVNFSCGNNSQGCPIGFDDCNGDITDLCEADLSTVQHCGGCNVQCGAGQSCKRDGASYSCS